MYLLGLRGNGFGDFHDGAPEVWTIRGDREKEDGLSVTLEDDPFARFMWGDREPIREDPEFWNLEAGVETPLAESYHRVPPQEPAGAAHEADTNPGVRQDLADRATLQDPGSW